MSHKSLNKHSLTWSVHTQLELVLRTGLHTNWDWFYQPMTFKAKPKAVWVLPNLINFKVHPKPI